MTSKKSHVVYNQRRKVLNHARDLARSGEHADHQTIIPQLVVLVDFEAVRSVFEDRVLCAQLDLLCARARNREEPLPELTSRRTQRGMHKLICEEFASPDMKRPA